MRTMFYSRMTRQEALAQNPRFPAPQEILDAQCLFWVWHWNFRDRVSVGQIVVHQCVARNVQNIFDDIFSLPEYDRFPIQSVIPVSDPRIAWDDTVSMTINNSSGFNYRTINGAEALSDHGFGLAFDLNPKLNPYFRADLTGGCLPKGAIYDASRPGTILPGSRVVEIAYDHGARWGGREMPDVPGLAHRIDFQHFWFPRSYAE